MAKVRFLGVATVLAGTTMGALALLAPITHGQQAADDRAAERRVVKVIRGGGSEIGVMVRDVDEADAKREATAGAAGAVIEEVRSGSPGEKAGYKAGDIVTGFDGERVRSARQFARLVEETPPGRRVKSTVARAGKPVELEVVPEASSGMGSIEPRAFSFRVEPDSAEIGREIERAEREARRSLEGLNRMPPSFKVMPERPGGFDFEAIMRPSRLGVGVLDLSPELAAHFGAKNGVVVNTVTPDSPAARAGIKVGDVITAVDGTPIDDSGDLRRRVWKDDDATTLSLGVVRDRREQTVKVPLDAPKRETAKRTRERV